MSLSLYIYENVFRLLFFGFLVFYFCTALWTTMVVLFCAIEINEMKINEMNIFKYMNFTSYTERNDNIQYIYIHFYQQNDFFMS